MCSGFLCDFLDSPIANRLRPRLTLVSSSSSFHLSRRPGMANQWHACHISHRALLNRGRTFATPDVDHEFRCLFCHSLMYQSQRVHGSNITLSLFLVERGGKIFPGPENKSLTYGHIFSTLDFRLVDLTRFCLSRTSHLFFQYIFSVSICRRLD